MLINSRWINIPIQDIYNQLVWLWLKTWGVKTFHVSGQLPYYYLWENGENYAYPYSLPFDVANELARWLNEANMWHQDYNNQAIAYFNEHNEALNQAAEYWRHVGDFFLPEPKIKPVDGLSAGDKYIAIIGLFHLTGMENRNNSHLYIELLDENGNRIYNHNPSLELYYGWEGISTDDANNIRPIRIDKPSNEPGANIYISWPQVVYGFHINTMAADRFSGIHTRYENDETGNNRGHHSHYIVLQKRLYQTDIILPDPDPDPPNPETVMLIKKSWLDTQEVDNDGFIRIKS